MNRYYFVLFGIQEGTSTGEGNIGLVCAEEQSFSNAYAQKVFRELYPQHEKASLVLRNFIEFANVGDYNNFWSKWQTKV